MQTITFKGSDIKTVHDSLVVTLADGRVLELSPEVVEALINRMVVVTCGDILKPGP